MCAQRERVWRALIPHRRALTNPTQPHRAQWWGLAWVRAYEATAQFEFLQRAAAVFDHIAASGWTASPCSGGVVWCPAPAGQGYKNAITSELFLSLAMDLHPYAAQLGRASTFFSSWAQRVWTWLEASGMRNSAGLFNDGLNVGADGACFNNNQTEWTYNQGVLVDALGKLGAATGNATLARVAESIVAATMALLSPNGILSEPCSSCDGDQHLFKGIWVRHAAALAAVDAAFAPTVHSFVLANARSLIANAACPGGGFGFSWSSACAIEDTATSSAALDLLVAAAEGGSAPEGAPWLPLGLGNCVDAVGSSMGNCYRNGVDEVACRTSADGDARAVAWDHESTCLGDGFCRVRTLAGAASCAAGWAWADGPATAVSSANGAALTTCYVRGTAV